MKKIIENYCKEYERVNGRSIRLLVNRRWIRIAGSGTSAYRAHEIVAFTEVLKARKSFNA